MGQDAKSKNFGLLSRRMKELFFRGTMATRWSMSSAEMKNYLSCFGSQKTSSSRFKLIFGDAVKELWIIFHNEIVTLVMQN